MLDIPIGQKIETSFIKSNWVFQQLYHQGPNFVSHSNTGYSGTFSVITLIECHNVSYEVSILTNSNEP